jgi:hypothetical protein
MTTYNIFDKEMYTETHHIIILNKQTNEIKTENKTYIFDGDNLMEINDPHEYNFKLFEIMQKIQKEYSKFLQKYAKPPIGYMLINGIMYEFMTVRNNILILKYANIIDIKKEEIKEIKDDEIKIIYKVKYIYNKDWVFESAENIPQHVKDQIANIIKNTFKNIIAQLKASYK